MSHFSRDQAAQSEALDEPHSATSADAVPRDRPLDAPPQGGAAPLENGAGAATADAPDSSMAAASAPMAEPPSTPGYGSGGHFEESSPDPQPSLVKEASALRGRWESVQVSFVDDPRQAVSDAEALVSDVISDMTSGFRQQRQELESRWNQGQEASTEQLRQALQRYRDFFERFLRV